MRIEQTRHGAVTVVRPMGPLSSQGDASVLSGEVEEVMRKSLGRFVLDASEVTYVDSYGLEALVDLSDKLGSSGKSLRISGVCDTVREVFSLTEITPKFQMYEDVQTAVRSFL